MQKNNKKTLSTYKFVDNYAFLTKKQKKGTVILTVILELFSKIIFFYSSFFLL